KELKKLILKIYNNKPILNELREENLTQIQTWSWKEKSHKWNSFFNFVLDKGHKLEKSLVLENRVLEFYLILKAERKTLKYILYRTKRLVKKKLENNYIGKRILWRYNNMKS